MVAGCDFGSTYPSAFGTPEGSAFRTIEVVGSTAGPPWAVFGASEAPTFRTIACGEIDGTPGCTVGELAREKITAALATAATAHATNVTKRV
jgi:hypothetical protein